MEKFDVIETTKGKPLALFKGYQYRRHRECKENVVSWLCVKEKSEKCKGRMKSKYGSVLEEFEHICKPDEAAVEVKQKLSSIRKRAREEDLPISDIYQQEMMPLFHKGLDFVTELPLLTSVKSGLYRARRISQGIQKEPSSALEIEIPNELLLMNDGDNISLIDKQIGDSRIFGFVTKKGRKALADYTSFFMDGTFKSCPKQFTQIYTIHADLGSTDEETNIVPIFYALLPNKRRSTYFELFTAIKEFVPQWNPETITMDFEEAAIAALINLFPQVNIQGCNFHWNQCLWRKIQNLGLVNEYRENENIRLHLRMCSALAYLPLEDVDDGWLLIQEQTDNNEKLVAFYDYFVIQWLENPIVGKKIWNCYGKKHRTNNAVEGWNNRLNKIVKTPHPNFYKFIKLIKSEAEYSDFLQTRQEVNLKAKKRKIAYIKLDQRIKLTLEKYHNTRDLKQCLMSLAYIQKFE